MIRASRTTPASAAEASFRQSDEGIARILEGVEPCNQVESLVSIRQFLQIALLKIGAGRTSARNRQQRVGRVKSRHLGAARCCDLGCHSRSTTNIEIACSSLYVRAFENRLIYRTDCAFLNVGPVLSPRAPQGCVCL